MLRKLSISLSALALVAFPAGAYADGATTTAPTPTASTTHGLLRAAARFDVIAAARTAKADKLQVASAALRVEAATTTPADAQKIAQADRLDRQAATFDKAAATFTAKAAAFRTKATTRLRKVDDATAAMASATKVRGLLNAAAKLRANAKVKSTTAATLRTEAAAATPIDQEKLDQAARLDHTAAILVANAIKLEAKAAFHAAKAEQAAAAAA